MNQTLITVTPENLDTLADYPSIADHLRAIATPGGSNFASLDVAEAYLRGAFPNAKVYRGGSHVALHLSATKDRILLVAERRVETPSALELDAARKARVQAAVDSFDGLARSYAAAYAHWADEVGVNDAAAEAASRGKGLSSYAKHVIRRAILAARLDPKAVR